MQKKIKPFPHYMYHRDYDEPRRVDNTAQAKELRNIGWKASRIWKEFPKMVEGVPVNNAEEEKLLLDAVARKPKVVIETKITDQHGNVVSHTGKDTQRLTPVPMKNSVQVHKNTPEHNDRFEIVGPDGDPIPDHVYETFDAARQVQKELNSNSPGHKARKIKQ